MISIDRERAMNRGGKPYSRSIPVDRLLLVDQALVYLPEEFTTREMMAAIKLNYAVELKEGQVTRKLIALKAKVSEIPEKRNKTTDGGRYGRSWRQRRDR